MITVRGIELTKANVAKMIDFLSFIPTRLRHTSSRESSSARSTVSIHSA